MAKLDERSKKRKNNNLLLFFFHSIYFITKCVSLCFCDNFFSTLTLLRYYFQFPVSWTGKSSLFSSRDTAAKHWICTNYRCDSLREIFIFVIFGQIDLLNGMEKHPIPSRTTVFCYWFRFSSIRASQTVICNPSVLEEKCRKVPYSWNRTALYQCKLEGRTSS